MRSMKGILLMLWMLFFLIQPGETFAIAWVLELDPHDGVKLKPRGPGNGW
jgi:hypothetical protein